MGRTYAELLSQARLNFEFWRGDIQNRGTYAVAMQVVGSPKMQRCGSSAGLSHRADNDVISSTGVVAAPIDVTGTFMVEASFAVPLAGRALADGCYFLYHVNLGGLSFFTYSIPGTLDVRVYLQDAAGATARRVYTNPDVYIPGGTLVHAVITSTAGGTAGAIWINGLPQAVNLLGAGVAANAGAASLYTMWGTTVVRAFGERVRAWQSALTQDEVSLLHENWQRMIWPSVV